MTILSDYQYLHIYHLSNQIEIADYNPFSLTCGWVHRWLEVDICLWPTLLRSPSGPRKCLFAPNFELKFTFVFTYMFVFVFTYVSPPISVFIFGLMHWSFLSRAMLHSGPGKMRVILNSWNLNSKQFNPKLSEQGQFHKHETLYIFWICIQKKLQDSC